MDVETRRIYERAGLGRPIRLGTSPAVLIVDLIYGFTDPASPLGGNLDTTVEATAEVLGVARRGRIPVIFTTISYTGMAEAALWPQKLPALAVLQAGNREVEVDNRLDRRADEPIVVKKGPSAFFGTNLASILVNQGVDTVVLCGASTSGCIRATAVDLMQYGYPTLVPRECVGDRAQAPHLANLLDIDAKYANVVPLPDATRYLETVPPRPAAQAAG